MDQLQQTIANTATITGRGLFSGKPATMTFRPAPADHGIVFVRKDLSDARVPATIEHIDTSPRRSMLKHADATIATTEHCLSALAALGVDNVLIEIDAEELPGLDGSAKPYYDVIAEAGLKSCDVKRNYLTVREPAIVESNGAIVAAIPTDNPALEIVFDLDYPKELAIGRQVRNFNLANGNFAEQIAPARTFVLESESRQLRSAGLGKHLGPKDVLVISREGPMGANAYRFDDELVRHKIVDLIGDLYLAGRPIHGRIMAYQSGHALNHMMVRELLKQEARTKPKADAKPLPVLDIKSLSRILPHRYPMLLVDRVISIEGEKRIRGLKNVTINEPFFQGHYPGAPIMPGVLIVEAMAQLSGVLIGQNLEHTGKLAVLLSLDKVKLRKPVTPGDQLIMEAETIKARSRIAHMRCRAFVDDALAAEAEVKFMLVDDEI